MAMSSNNAPVLITLDQAADMVSTSTRTIRRWISTGRLKQYRFSRRVIRVDREELLALGRDTAGWGAAA